MRWCENYVCSNSWLAPLRALDALKDGLAESRYHIYVFVTPLKVVVFLLIALLSAPDIPIMHFFTHFTDGWQAHDMPVHAMPVLLADESRAGTADETLPATILSTPMTMFWVGFVHVCASWLFYVFAKFSCKIQIQSFSFALPANLTVPVAVLALIVMCGLRTANVCALHEWLPDYLFVRTPRFYELWHFVADDGGWVWLLWMLSQAWITKHVWTPQSDRNSATERLFVAPMYASLLIDQCVTMNRTREDRDGMGTMVSRSGGKGVV